MDIVWYLMPVLVIFWFLKTNWFKGVLGEFLVNRTISRGFDQSTSVLLKDITLPTEDGSTQIDHILVSVYGVYVIETKNMTGWIYGSLNQKSWTQKIYKSNRKFQNPLHQNYKHLVCIRDLLGLPMEKMRSLVVFVGDCTFKTVMPGNVIRRNQLVRYISENAKAELEISEVFDIADAIKSGSLPSSFRTRRAHLKHVKSIAAKKEESV